MEDIFAIGVDDLDKPESKGYNSENEFKPDPKKATDKVYRAKIRPVYWLDNTKLNYIQKTVFFFDKDAGNTSNDYTFESKYSVDQSKGACPAMDYFFDLNRKKKEDARAKANLDKVRPKTSYYYLVLVESDVVTSDNEGKLMLYKAPVQVHRIIQAAIHPSKEDEKIGKKPSNIFDPFNGKSLVLSINLNGGQWNYNGTVEWATPAPVEFNGAPLTEDKKGEFVEFLKPGNEMMKAVEYKEMSAERLKLLLSIISSKTGHVFKGYENSSVNAELQIDNFEEADETPQEETAEEEIPTSDVPVKESAPEAEAKSEESSDDDDEFAALIDDIEL